MSDERVPDLSFFLNILQTLEAIDAPYMIIGAFAAALYGVNRTTYDIDIVVDLDKTHIQALTAAYPLPRYYADPAHMRNAIREGRMFNLIDTDRGEKADLIPVTMTPYYAQAFNRRVRQTVEAPGIESRAVWCARPEDVIVGKLMAWMEGRSRRHETDIYEMVVFDYLGVGSMPDERLDEAYIDAQARALGEDVVELWEAVKGAAAREAGRTHL